MAAHITCHSNECLPNRFPPPRPTKRDHKNVMLSDYEKGHVMYQSIPSVTTDVRGGTSFPPEEDIDPLPVYRRITHKHSNHQNIETLMDPALSLTPEKTVNKKGSNMKDSYKPTASTSCLKDPLTNSKNAHVRFDQQVTIQHLSPEHSDDASIIDIDHTTNTSGALNFDDEYPFEDSANDIYNSDDGATGLYASSGLHSHYLINRSEYPITDIISQTDELNLTTEDSEIISDTNCETLTQSTPSPVIRRKVLRHAEKKSFYKPDISEEDVIDVRPHKMASCKPVFLSSSCAESALARPEFNSTLFMSKELQELTKQEMDLPAVVSEKLKSEKLRSKIQEKASIKLNREEEQFANLVSMEINDQDLIATVEKEISSKTKQTHKSKQKRPEDFISKPPDIMDFFTPDLQREVPSLSLQDIPLPVERPNIADSLSAFEVYQHSRTWEDW